jgi:hypothetical protein
VADTSHRAIAAPSRVHRALARCRSPHRQGTAPEKRSDHFPRWLDPSLHDHLLRGRARQGSGLCTAGENYGFFGARRRPECEPLCIPSPEMSSGWAVYVATCLPRPFAIRALAARSGPPPVAACWAVSTRAHRSAGDPWCEMWRAGLSRRGTRGEVAWPSISALCASRSLRGAQAPGACRVPSAAAAPGPGALGARTARTFSVLHTTLCRC